MENVKTGKAYKGLPMEGPIASWYAKNTLQDLKRHTLMAAKLVKEIPAGGRVLEIAPGPGYFCIELAKLGNFQINGLDISKSFVEIARRNAAAAGVRAEFRQGDASATPFEAESFDFIFCQAAFKNFSRPVQAIAEMYRVLRPGGTALLVDLRRDASPAGIEQEIKGMGLGPVNEALTRWTFRLMLLKSAYSVTEIEAFISQTRFARYEVRPGEIGFEAWMWK